MYSLYPEAMYPTENHFLWKMEEQTVLTIFPSAPYCPLIFQLFYGIYFHWKGYWHIYRFPYAVINNMERSCVQFNECSLMGTFGKALTQYHNWDIDVTTTYQTHYLLTFPYFFLMLMHVHMCVCTRTRVCIQCHILYPWIKSPVSQAL